MGKLRANVPNSDGQIDEEVFEDDIEQRVENAVNIVGLHDEDEHENVFNLPCGLYKDDAVHTEFELREMTGRDEEAINKADVRANGSKVTSILLRRCVTRIGSYTPKSVGEIVWQEIIRSLVIGDQDFMMMKLRQISIGNDLTFECNCPGCKTRLKTILPIEEIEFKEYQGSRVIPFELPSGYYDRKGVVHKVGKMRLPNGLDREILTPMARTNLAKADTLMLTRICTFDDGFAIDDSVMADLTVRDRKYLNTILDENRFGYDFRSEIFCDSCGEMIKVSLDQANFL